MAERPIVLVSNRGPISFHRADDGELEPVRGAGGLVSGLSPLLAGTDRQWIAAALSDDDRAAVAASTSHVEPGRTPFVEVSSGGLRSVLAAVEPRDLQLSYDIVCNATLWYLHHHLFGLARTPVFDLAWFDAWDAYRRVNHAFADVVAHVAPEGAVVLVQDYHLCLVGPMVAERRSDVRTVHFSHTPFATPDLFAVLPTSVRRELLDGLAGHDACGFHTDRWRNSFESCCARDDIQPPATFVAALGPDESELAATSAGAACRAAIADLEQRIGDRHLVARVDRIELSKNLLRGFEAFEMLLDRFPVWRDRVCFAASVYPSRESNADYVAYRDEVDALVGRINDRWATDTWTPIIYDSSDNFPTSVAALARADVVLVNPVRDGLNLVAKEAMLVSEHDGLLALSPESGAWEEFVGVATAVHPFDIVQTAEALAELLALDSSERAARSAALRKIAAARTPADWLADQLTAAG